MISDGYVRSYLIGIGEKFEVFVARIGTDGAPESYAVLDGTTVDWGNGTEVSKGEFGAAFAYQSLEGDAELLFAENGGAGLFRLELPLDIPTDCWNTGDATGSHTACNEPATLVWVGPSSTASSNDGMNCPYQEPPTPVPTTAAPHGRRPTRRRVEADLEPTSPYRKRPTPTHEPTSTADGPPPSTYARPWPDVAREIAFQLSRHALLLGRDLTLRMEDGTFAAVWQFGDATGVALHTEGDDEDAEARLYALGDKLSNLTKRQSDVSTAL